MKKGNRCQQKGRHKNYYYWKIINLGILSGELKHSLYELDMQNVLQISFKKNYLLLSLIYKYICVLGNYFLTPFLNLNF